MLACFADRDWRSQLVALPEPNAELELVIEAAARAIFGSVGVRGFALPARTDHRFARRTHRACAAVIADRDIFIVWQQRIVGPELLADIHGVVNADVEISVVPDEARHVHSCLGLADQLRLHVIAVALVAQDLGEPFTKRSLRLLARASQPFSTG